MKDKLIYWIDRMIHVWEDTMPNPEEEDPTTQMWELEELKRIKAWIISENK